MGIYDRDYYQERQRGFSFGGGGGGRSMVINLVLINVAVYLVEIFGPTDADGRSLLAEALALHVGDLTQPWYWWRFVTAGFTHDPYQWQHLAFNMFALWMFGRDVEAVYGAREFLFVYLTMIVVASLVWIGIEKAQGAPPSVPMVGASGAVTGILILFCANFPNRTVLLFFVLPMPAWVLAVLMIVLDLTGQFRSDENIAFTAHLGGAAFAGAYWWFGWRMERWLPSGNWLSGMQNPLKRKPRLRVHDPRRDEPGLSERVDKILQKIHDHGEESLTAEERRTLEDASRRYQRRSP